MNNYFPGTDMDSRQTFEDSGTDIFDIKQIKTAINNPLKAWRYLQSVLRGLVYKQKFKLLRRRVEIGKNFSVTGRLVIKGPGKVIMGNNVVIDGTSHAVNLWT